jgi:AcrR family transcriptional regulator
VTAERGYAGASVTGVLARAKVSRVVFYERFAGLEAALVAVIDDTLEAMAGLVGQAFEEEESRQDGLRSALAEVLAFLDSRPALARVCIIEALGAGQLVLARRERNIGALGALITQHIDVERRESATLAAEAVMASVVGIVQARLVKREPEPLIGLLGTLMALIVGTQFGARAAAPEMERGDQIARTMLAASAESPLSRPSHSIPESDSAVPAWVRDPAAYRARSCLLYVADRPGVSNRQIAAGIGVTHQGQASTLLKRLVSDGLLVKRSMGVGRRNIWQLTAYGDQVAGTLRASY